MISQYASMLSGAHTFDDPRHPVHKARDWIADEDQLQLCPDNANFIQRYILALLYYSTAGDNWMRCTVGGETPCQGERFLSASHECHWGGVTCDSLDRVKKLNLGKLYTHSRRITAIMKYSAML